MICHSFSTSSSNSGIQVLAKRWAPGCVNAADLCSRNWIVYLTLSDIVCRAKCPGCDAVTWFVLDDTCIPMLQTSGPCGCPWCSASSIIHFSAINTYDVLLHRLPVSHTKPIYCATPPHLYPLSCLDMLFPWYAIHVPSYPWLGWCIQGSARLH